MSRRMFASLVCVAVLATATVGAFQAKPANLSGTWTGTFAPDPSDVDRIHAVLKHTGKELTGTAGPSAETQYNVTKGVVAQTKEGTTVTFLVATNGPVLQFELKLVDGHLKGTAKAERDGQKLSAVVDLERAK
jgi:hypothetical protein